MYLLSFSICIFYYVTEDYIPFQSDFHIIYRFKKEFSSFGCAISCKTIFKKIASLTRSSWVALLVHLFVAHDESALLKSSSYIDYISVYIDL